jgi:hypothetical protein
VSSGKWLTDSGQSRLFFHELSGVVGAVQDLFIFPALIHPGTFFLLDFLSSSDRTEKH